MVVDLSQFHIKEYFIPDNIQMELLKEAKMRAEIDTAQGIHSKDFSSKFEKRYIADFYGLHGEFAVKSFFIEHKICFESGTKFASSYTTPDAGITHDFIINVANRNVQVGVKTGVILKYNSLEQFFEFKSYNKYLFYPYRGAGSVLKGHTYPELLFFCFYLPRVHRNKVYIFGFVDRATIINSKLVKIYNKDTHLIHIYNFKPCSQAILLLKSNS